MTEPQKPQLSAVDPFDGAELRLPREPGVIRSSWARHPRLSDTLIALFWGLLAATGAASLERETSVSVWATIATLFLIAVSVAGFYVRRTRPLLTVALSGAVILASIWSPDDVVLAPAVFAVYSVPIHRSARAGWIAAAGVEAAAIVASLIGEYLPRSSSGINPFNPAEGAGLSVFSSVLAFSIQFGVILALALAIGINVGNRRRYLSALVDRARQLAVERDQRGQLAAAAERARIAREMHDIVSHSLTVMIALSEGSAAAAEPAAPEAAAAMRRAADTGRDAMTDMRRMLGVLGGDTDAQIAPQPGFADLPELIEQFRALGIPVTYRLDDVETPDPIVQLAVHRVVQEALTNTLRYAHGPSQVTVRIGVDHGSLIVAVTDNGMAGFPTKPAGTGRGLLGLRERVTALGGTLAAGPIENGHGWRVEARLPLNEETDTPAR
ncbi:histidine kinase [Rathayibacter sp. YIM 133350]|uniref:sensor histidine kinase n=1 Tax=Rathayibacter sp. YIM 133350 TaxID=3131992 RepID=UPI00307D110F